MIEVKRASVLVVGAGIVGVITAKFLVERGVENIVVIDEKYPGSGGTFRCATGIRASFTSIEHVEAMKRSIELWAKLAKQHGFEYQREGYLWMMTREEDLKLFSRVASFHNKHGIPSRLVSTEEIREIVPYINLDGVVGGLYDPLAGKADNFRALLEILRYIETSGVSVYRSTKAYGLVARGNRVVRVETSRGLIEADVVVIAAGHGSKKLLNTLGVKLPTKNVAKHALITEAFQYNIKPLIIDWASSSYLVQVFHGGFLIGAELEEESDTKASNRIDYLYRAARIWVKYFPWLREVRVLRYWTGYYVMTPDHHPVIGPIGEYDNLYVATGFSGHGFMMAPITGEALADYITKGKPSHSIMEKFRLERFKRGKLIKEIAVFG